MHSTSDGQWYGVIATLDTGSDESWTSQNVVDRLILDVTKGLTTKWKTFSGETVASDSTVRATWCNRGVEVSYANVFRAIPNAPFDVLFGRNTLLSGEINLFAEDFNAGSVLVHTQDPLTEAEIATIKAKQAQVNKESEQLSQGYGIVIDDTSDSSEEQPRQGQGQSGQGQGQQGSSSQSSKGKGKVEANND